MLSHRGLYDNDQIGFIPSRNISQVMADKQLVTIVLPDKRTYKRFVTKIADWSALVTEVSTLIVAGTSGILPSIPSPMIFEYVDPDTKEAIRMESSDDYDVFLAALADTKKMTITLVSSAPSPTPTAESSGNSNTDVFFVDDEIGPYFSLPNNR